MTLRIVWSREADDDLLQIWSYLASEASIARADDQIQKNRTGFPSIIGLTAVRSRERFSYSWNAVDCGRALPDILSRARRFRSDRAGAAWPPGYRSHVHGFAMTEILFYHLQGQKLEGVLTPLLEK